MAKRLVIFISVGLSVQAVASDPNWIEGRWVSNGDLSAKANPQTEHLAPADLVKFKSLFGKTIWHFENGMFTGIQTESGYESSSPYYIRPAEEGRWEIIFYQDSYESGLTVWRVEGGFCADTVPGWIKEQQGWSKAEIIECYIPDDA